MNQSEYTKSMIEKTESVIDEKKESIEEIVEHMNNYKDDNLYGLEALKQCHIHDVRPEYFLNSESKLELNNDQRISFEEAVSDYQISEQKLFIVAKNEGWEEIQAKYNDGTKKSVMLNPDSANDIDNLYDEKLVPQNGMAIGDTQIEEFNNDFVLPDIKKDEPEQDQVQEQEQTVEQKQETTFDNPEPVPEEEQKPESNKIEPHQPDEKSKDKISMEQKFLQKLLDDGVYRMDGNKLYSGDKLAVELHKSITGGYKRGVVHDANVDNLYNTFALLPKSHRILSKAPNTDQNFNAFKGMLEKRLENCESIEEFRVGKKVDKRFHDVLAEMKLKAKNEQALEVGVEEPENAQRNENKTEQKVEVGCDTEKPENSDDEQLQELKQETEQSNSNQNKGLLNKSRNKKMRR
ncbi:hypothetical protein OTK51_13250 [Vibrio scophthalmi]|uniref:hypothetical protein n=1 Tax=Vibrio scophthalmi TaxID=45658 RepID=UPI002283856E|nr:hypothetical protein [Vibrio scophthalmi]MCY9804394.1 hypothetical protein [Vibrio scophthalmi]